MSDSVTKWHEMQEEERFKSTSTTGGSINYVASTRWDVDREAYTILAHSNESAIIRAYEILNKLKEEESGE